MRALRECATALLPNLIGFVALVAGVGPHLLRG